jgi:glc operon protein GlcG
MTSLQRSPLRAALLAVTAILGAGRALAAEEPAMSLALAKRVAGAAAVEAARLSAPGGAIAIVDEGGHLVYLERLDGTFPAAAVVSNEKARTAALFRQPTANLENAIKNGRSALLGVSVMTPLQGGVPIALDGRVLGAIGVSGAASAQQDTEIAEAAVQSLLAPVSAAGVLHLRRARVEAAFARGEPLTETPLYKVHASRRDAPGSGEVHVADTDIIHVLSGSATLTTGGELVEAREIAPNELRGPRIAGGTRRTIGTGDVVVVPAGVPHWFEQVDGPVTYYVVKATGAGAR